MERLQETAIEVLIVCEWVGSSLRSIESERPSWDDVESAIRALDNASRNDVYLHPRKNDPETYLCIGGGAGRYLVAGSIRNERFPTAVDPSRAPSPLEELVVGGQPGAYPANRILDLEAALRAARTFFATGEFTDAVTWRDG